METLSRVLGMSLDWGWGRGAGWRCTLGRLQHEYDVQSHERDGATEDVSVGWEEGLCPGACQG